MAIIKLSGLLTEIRGSAGGTTFRKIGNKATMYNKDMSRAGHGQRNGGNIEALNRLSKQWKSLTVADRNAWNAKAPGYNRTDRFGNLVPYTGRELFYHMISTRNIFNINDLSFNYGSDSINTYNVSVSKINSDTSISYSLSGGSGIFRLLIRVQKISETAKQGYFKKYVLIYQQAQAIGGNKLSNKISRFVNYPIKTGDKFAIFFTFCSSSGLRAEPIQIISTVQ